MSHSGTLFIICGPSGAGKTTVVNAALTQLQSTNKISRVVTCTSRSSRPGEQQGVDYHFMPAHEFKARIDQNYFLEWSTVYGTYYGTPASVIKELEQQRNKILIMDLHGARQLYKYQLKAEYIWITVDSITTLKTRLESRSSDTPQAIDTRLSLAKEEMDYIQQSSIFSHLILNENLALSTQKLTEIIKNSGNF